MKKKRIRGSYKEAKQIQNAKRQQEAVRLAVEQIEARLDKDK